jgi:hypothetical protein
MRGKHIIPVRGEWSYFMPRRRRLLTDAPLRDSPEHSVGLVLPAAISDRVDALVALTEEIGERTNRRELIASLILAAPTRGEDLSNTLRRYRRATVRDTLLQPNSVLTEINSPIHKPGPRVRVQR